MPFLFLVRLLNFAHRSYPLGQFSHRWDDILAGDGLEDPRSPVESRQAARDRGYVERRQQEKTEGGNLMGVNEANGKRTISVLDAPSRRSCSR